MRDQVRWQVESKPRESPYCLRSKHPQTAIGDIGTYQENRAFEYLDGAISLQTQSQNANDERPKIAGQTVSGKGQWHLVVLTIAVVSVGIFAQYLNQTLYLTKAPFFDSVRYYDRLYEVVSIRQQEGLAAAIENATQSSSTFCLPYLLAIPFSYLMEPSRAIGVWIEVFYLSLFAFSFSAYLRRNLRASSRQIIFSFVPLLLMNALYRSTAGISDLRVDLPLAFLYGAAACWWLMGRKHSRWRYFVTAGLCVGLACLTRATAPIFFMVGFVPIVVFDFVQTDNRARLFGQFLLVAGITFVMSGWFFIVHFKFIYFYYAVWNTDANATVSIFRSLKHLVAVLKSVGVMAGIYFAVIYFVARNENTVLDSATRISRRKEWGPLAWLAIAPVALLVLKRTDINPFVSLPSALGLLMLLVVLFIDRIKIAVRDYQFRIAAVAATLMISAAVVGILDHTTKQWDTVTPHQKVVQVLKQNANQLERRQIVYSVNLLSSINTASLEGTFQFSPGASFIDSETVEIDNVRYTVSHEMLNPSQANWDRLPGETVDEKIQRLENRVAAQVDYVVSPTIDSVPTLQARYAYSHSSRYASKILTQFGGSGNWKPISETIDVEPGLKVHILKNISSGRVTLRKQSKLR